MSEMTRLTHPSGKAWDHHVSVKDIMEAYDDGKVIFVEMRDQFVARLRAMPLYQQRIEGSVVLQEYDDFVEAIDGLAQSDDEQEFQGYLDDIYDWADKGKRLWIETL